MEDAQRKILLQGIEARRWFHRIHLGDGIFTPGPHGPSKLPKLGIPTNLSGWSVLDVGANDGFFSFTCESRGAKVLATDWNWWTGVRAGREILHPAHIENFLFVREALKSEMEYRVTSVYDIDPNQIGTFDLVLFLGVLYHNWHPMLALEKLYKVTEKMLIVETAVLAEDNPEAVMLFKLEGYDRDPTNWWYPNTKCVIDMMKAVGFAIVEDIALAPGDIRKVIHGYKTENDYLEYVEKMAYERKEMMRRA